MEKEIETGIIKFMLLGAIIIIGLQVGFGTIIYFSLGGWEKTGVFGDTFGALNPLFSGLAFAGVILAIILQMKELALQRKELEYTRTELSRTAGAQERTQKAIEDQAKLIKIAVKLHINLIAYKESAKTIEEIIAVSDAEIPKDILDYRKTLKKDFNSIMDELDEI